MFAGGGTLGPVTPLLAVAKIWKKIDNKATFIWVGTKNGPEKAFIEEAGLPFLYLPVARFTRYPSFEWLFLPFRMLAAFVMAWLLISREQPDLVATAGGFTGVPLAWVAKLRRIPVWIHQPDVKPLLSNLLMAPVATCITVAWKESVKSFPKYKTIHIGNPVREEILAGTKDKAFERFGLDLKLPTIFVTGGGGGSAWLNHMMEDLGQWLAGQANIIHLTGKGKLYERLKHLGNRYHPVERLVEDMPHALAAADIVVSRAGMGIITELSALKKAAILIPYPGKHQAANAAVLEKAGAAIVLPQLRTSLGDLKKALKELLDNKDRRLELGENIAGVLPSDVGEEMVQYVKKVCFEK